MRCDYSTLWKFKDPCCIILGTDESNPYSFSSLLIFPTFSSPHFQYEISPEKSTCILVQISPNTHIACNSGWYAAFFIFALQSLLKQCIFRRMCISMDTLPRYVPFCPNSLARHRHCKTAMIALQNLEGCTAEFCRIIRPAVFPVSYCAN